MLSIRSLPFFVGAAGFTLAPQSTLLHEWLSRLLHRFLQDGFIAATITVLEIDEAHIHARLTGEKLDYERHDFETEIKAVTYHKLSVRNENGRWTAQVIFDV